VGHRLAAPVNRHDIGPGCGPVFPLYVALGNVNAFRTSGLLSLRIRRNHVSGDIVRLDGCAPSRSPYRPPPWPACPLSLTSVRCCCASRRPDLPSGSRREPGRSSEQGPKLPVMSALAGLSCPPVAAGPALMTAARPPSVTLLWRLVA